MNVLLVITTGQTDIQLVRDGARVEFSKDHCAALHDELQTREGEWSITNAPLIKARDSASALPQSPFQLCTPKLDAVLSYIAASNVTLTHALLLDTRRDASAAPGDPRYAGAILDRRLRELLGDVVVWQTTFLKAADRLEDRNEPRDAVIRRAVVACIDEAIRSAVQNSGPDRIVVAATGGMPGVASLVEEIVRLHAGSRPKVKVELVEVADGTKADPPAGDRAVPRQPISEPAESYRTRRHALALIEGGNLLGAWGAVRHLHDDEAEHRWTQVVEWLSCFAASLPLANECDIDVLKHPRMAVHAALRVEFALRSGDVPRAVHGTVAFFEAALWDHLALRLSRHPTESRLFSADPPPNEQLVRSFEDEKRKPFEVAKMADGVTWYRVFDDDVCAIRLAKHYLRLDNLVKLGQATSKIRELRNDVAHNEPTPDLMNDARRRMADAALWSTEGRFLTQPLVQSVLTDLDEEHPECLCDNLIAMVRSRLLAG